MRTKRFHCILAALCAILLPATLAAQDYILEVLPGKKVIHVKNLAMPDQTSVQDVLMMVPELMSRGDELFNYFDIKYADKSVGEGRDVILVQTLLEDVQDIEISTSSVSTQSRNGQSGVINIVPRSLPEGFGGEALLDGTTEWDAMLGADLGYKNDRMELRGKLNLEYYRPDEYVTFADITPQRTVSGVDETIESYLQQTVKVDFKYDISKRDQLLVWLVESHGMDDTRDIIDRKTVYDMSGEKGKGWQYVEDESDTVDSSERSVDFDMAAQYAHKFDNGSSVNVSGSYSMNRSRNTVSESHPETFDLAAQGAGAVLDANGHKLTLKGGVNATYKILRSSDMDVNSLYASPFCELDWSHNGLSVEATARYQYFDRSIQPLNGSTPYGSVEHDVVASINSLWQVCPHHALRMSVSRNLVRPTDMMLYPGLTYYYTLDRYLRGNPDLKRSYIHAAELGYITDRSRNGHTVVLDVGLGYARADGLIESHNDYLDGSSLFYMFYENSGANNIFTANASVIYKYGILTMAFAGNAFFNDMHLGTGHDRFNYYNFSLSPMFSFNRGWTLTSRLMYNSAVVREENTLGDCFYAKARLSKAFGNWTLSATLSDIFDYTTKDSSVTSLSLVTSEYDLYKRYVGLGASYRFGSKSAGRK